jgi:prolyl 3-hydroxylase /prolyl 3,4-dihydroxylase
MEWLNPAYDAAQIKKLKAQYAKAKPFPHIGLRGLLAPAKLKALQAAFAKQKFSRKDADLFSFRQTDDLHTVKDKTIKEFLKLLQSKEFTRLINEITGVKTTAGKVDASGFIYEKGDYLLCHDDGISSRRIAYIFYLNTVPAKSGGSLSLFGSNRKNEPTRTAKRIFPEANTLAIFTVSKKSHHQVDEVLSGKRMTITGWFHE